MALLRPIKRPLRQMKTQAQSVMKKYPYAAFGWFAFSNHSQENDGRSGGNVHIKSIIGSVFLTSNRSRYAFD